MRAHRNLGQKVFSRPGAAAVKEEELGWRDSLYRVYKSSQARARDHAGARAAALCMLPFPALCHQAAAYHVFLHRHTVNLNSMMSVSHLSSPQG